ncbi:sugar porter family MFS transporter [Flexithrix dorotheae]|uniref:sugar porter family MFS transporter n=1 Tax=Flexithrix dorotheae TaxID=70993 RepID=UPI00037581BD|nr:sugar porter family MFS transporter [Flexithrix dorotheae]
MEKQTQTNHLYITGITLVATLGGFLFGYDTGVIAGSGPYFRSLFDLSPAVFGFVVASALIGCMVGSIASGYTSKTYGRKNSLLIAGILFFISALGSAIAGSATELVIYRLIGGVGVGLASAVAPVYIAELAPATMRGKLVSINQLAIVLGFVVVFFVNYFIQDPVDVSWNEQTGWRWMFGSECLPAALFFLLALFVPRSPRWLMLKGKEAEARKIVNRIDPLNVDIELEEIKNSLKNVQKGFNLQYPKIGLILTIGIGLSVFQQVTGINAILYYGNAIFESMGAGAEAAMINQIVVGLAMMVFTIVAIFTVEKFGRKPLILIGTAGMGIMIFIFGQLMYMEILSVANLTVLVLYIAFFSFSQGPIVWVYLSEIFPNKVRGIAMSIAVFAQWLANYAVSQTFPIMADEEGYLFQEFNGAFPFWMYGGFCILAVIFIWKLLPETKGKSLEQLESIWHDKKELA